MRQMALMRGRSSLQVGARTIVPGMGPRAGTRCYSAGGGGIDCENRDALGEHFAKTMEFHLAVDFDETHGGYYQQITRKG
eukprot:COSAG01_NODE_63173_length_281_cov_0.571429_1_plen_79_part_01